MQTNPRGGYRSSGLIAVLGLVALLIGVIVMLLLPSIRYAAWLVLVLGILLLTTAFIIDFRRVSRALTGRRGRFGISATVMASTFIGIILLVNAISIGSYHRFDVTGLAQFTLTPQTKEVLGKLEMPVQILCFFTPNDTYGIGSYATGLLTEYQNYTDQLTVKIIDPDEHPDQARSYGITQYQTVVFETEGGRRLVSPGEIVQFDDQGNQTGVEAEHPFTSAILEVTGTVQKKVYFLTGHGESDISAEYAYAAEGLRDDLYLVGQLNLITTPGIPEDCAALIIAGPQQPLMNSEVGIIEQYLESGRQALLLVNPNSPQEIKQLLSNWGVEIGDGIVIDPSSYVSPSIDSPSVPSTRNAFDLSVIYFPGATAIIPHPEYVPTLTVTEAGEMSSIVWKSENSQIQMYRLIWTSNDSWLEMNYDSSQEPEFDEGTDQKGTLALSFLIFTSSSSENTGEQEAALIVIGDSDFASNQHFNNGNNSDLFLGSVNWLTAGKELISIHRTVLPFRRLVVGPAVTRFINYSSIGLLPLLVLIGGGILWWRRR